MPTPEFSDCIYRLEMALGTLREYVEAHDMSENDHSLDWANETHRAIKLQLDKVQA